MSKHTFIFVVAFTLISSARSYAQLSWTEVNHSYFLDNRVATCLMFDDRGTLYAGSWNGLHISTDKGQTWSLVDYFKQIEVDQIIQADNGHLFVAGWRQSGTPKGVEGIWRSVDHGTTWKCVSDQDWASIRAYTIAAMTDGSLIAGTENGLLRSTDDGDTWSLSNGRFHPTAPYPLKVVNAIHRAPNGSLFAQIGGPVFGRSTNGGTVWSYILDSINAQAVMSIDSDGRVFVPGDSGVYRSTDNGDSWQFVRLPQNLQVYSLSLAASNGWILGLDARPILSTDHGDTWHEIRNGLTWYSNASAAIESPDHYVYFTQLTGALWRTSTPLSTSTVSTSSHDTPFTITPNPATDRIHILAPESVARVELCDPLGTVVRSTLSPISESLSLKGLIRGVYFVRAYTRTGRIMTQSLLVR